MKNTRGMTLLEIMTAVAVLGVITTLAVTSMQGNMDLQRENSATRTVVSRRRCANS